MMAYSDDIEPRWVAAWNDLYDIVADRWNVQCLLPEWQIVDMEECLGWLQTSVYEGWQVKVEPGWILGNRGIISSRWRD